MLFPREIIWFFFCHDSNWRGKKRLQNEQITIIKINMCSHNSSVVLDRQLNYDICANYCTKAIIRLSYLHKHWPQTIIASYLHKLVFALKISLHCCILVNYQYCHTPINHIPIIVIALLYSADNFNCPSQMTKKENLTLN